jgi:hypothetical protein
MNTHVSISSALAGELYSAAEFLAGNLAAIPTPDPRQAEMDLGFDQAVDEFMAERDVLLQAIEAFQDDREDLKAIITELRGVNQRQGAVIRSLIAERDAAQMIPASIFADVASLKAEADAAVGACRMAAEWVQIVRDKLVGLGITITTDEAGIPQLTINIDELSAQAADIQNAVALAI